MTANPSVAQQIVNAVKGGAPLEADMIERILRSQPLPPQPVGTIKTPGQQIVDYAKAHGLPCHGNSNVSGIMGELGLYQADLQPGVVQAMENLLTELGIDWQSDHNSEDTPKRVAKMLLQETWAGRYDFEPSITDFPNASNTDQLIVEGPLAVESVCSHHHQNIRGRAFIGILPKPLDQGGKVVGLSKYARILRHFGRRPQIQEELTVQVADYLFQTLEPRGVGIMIRAEHQCMSVRGVH